jgi:hypothetical protein
LLFCRFVGWPTGPHTIGNRGYQCLDPSDLAIHNFKQLSNKKRIGLVERRIHGMFGAVGPRDRFVFARMIDADDRPHQAALFIHHRESAFLHARNHFGKSGCELRATAHSGNRTLASGIVRSDHTVLDALAIFIEGSVFVGARFHAFEVGVRDANQFGARAAFGGRQRSLSSLRRSPRITGCPCSSIVPRKPTWPA